jgi:isopenicillin N synthase-like dioxygenase
MFHHAKSCVTTHICQVANYPSQLLPPGPSNLRKKAHTDSGTLTLLASQDYLHGSGWQAGNGGLQLLSASRQWLEVEVPPGEYVG